jgi:HD-GYP domain-containing protein (c-di-GMP phosphodiesterase class II)
LLAPGLICAPFTTAASSLHGSTLANPASMTLSRAALASASATAAAAAAVLLRREQTTRQTTERFAAAALETLLNAIDANDAETGAHVRRVATYSLILGESADLSEHECMNVERVALFHDIGKIHEALFDITHEDTRLTPAERRAIATHPERGAQVLAPLSGFYPDLAEGVLSHHERWDGKGYPRRLKGSRIPLSARLVAIADTFDAITHRRRYREGQPVDVAKQVLLEGRGTQWDPSLVDLFLFPPVFARIVAAERRVVRWRRPVQQRRTGENEENVPDINFRWRPGRHGARGRPASDQTRRTVR